MALSDVPSSAFASICSGVQVQEVVKRSTMKCLIVSRRPRGQDGQSVRRGLCVGVYVLVEQMLLSPALGKSFRIH